MQKSLQTIDQLTALKTNLFQAIQNGNSNEVIRIFDSELTNKNVLANELQPIDSYVSLAHLDQGTRNYYQNKQSITPLEYAIYKQNIEIILILLQIGAHIFFPYTNSSGTSIIRDVTLDAIQLGNYEITDLLLKFQAAFYPQSQTNLQTERLLKAIELGRNNIVDLLLRFGADPNRAGEGTGKYVSSEPFNVAIETNNFEALQLLIRYGLNVNQVNPSGDSPLIIAARTKNTPMVLLLIQNGANIQQRDRFCSTVLHQAAWNIRPIYISDPNLVEILISYGFDVNDQNNDGDTPLHLAARDMMEHSADPDIVKILLSHGADPLIENNQGHTVYRVTSDNMIDVLDRWPANWTPNMHFHRTTIPQRHQIQTMMNLQSQAGNPFHQLPPEMMFEVIQRMV